MLFRILIISLLLSSSQPSLAESLSDRLTKIFGGSSSSDEILSPDVAFTYEASVSDPNLIKLHWQVQDGYYLYRDKFKFSITEGDAQIEQSQLKLPAGKVKEDPAFGQVVINTGEFFIDLPLQRSSKDQTAVTLEVRYQGCKDESVCYPPITKFLSLTLPPIIASAEAASTNSQTSTSNTSLRLSEQDAITAKLKDGSILLNIIAFFGFGLLLSLTPCVFPMIPILSGIIVGQGTTITTARAFLLSLFYVLAMALTYAVLGVIAGSFYFNLQAAFQNVWVISLFSLVFVALALSMFGFYEFQLPSAIQSRLTSTSNNQRGGTLQGAALMGALSAIIVGPCVAPPLAGALLYISQTGNALLGGLALFAMGLGFGVPLLLIGSSAGSILPKAGIWMDAIKQVFGVIMLGVAIWFMERVIPAQIALLLWAALMIISSVYMGALDKLNDQTGWAKLWKGLGIILLVYGVILVIGAASGSNNLYKPLQGLSMSSNSAESKHAQFQFKSIKSISDLNKEIAIASQQEKIIMLDFYADWCVVCKEMESYTFSDDKVSGLMKEFTLLQADVTKNDQQDRELLKEFELYGPPAILFFDVNGLERISHRVVGFVKADKFTNHLNEVKDRAL
jgi:thioredoxin:protein disulfide reductase